METKRELISMTIAEAKEVLKLEMAFDRSEKPTKITLHQVSKTGYLFVVSYDKWADEVRGFTFNGRKCYATYKYLESKGFKL